MVWLSMLCKIVRNAAHVVKVGAGDACFATNTLPVMPSRQLGCPKPFISLTCPNGTKSRNWVPKGLRTEFGNSMSVSLPCLLCLFPLLCCLSCFLAFLLSCFHASLPPRFLASFLALLAFLAILAFLALLALLGSRAWLAWPAGWLACFAYNLVGCLLFLVLDMREKDLCRWQAALGMFQLMNQAWQFNTFVWDNSSFATAQHAQMPQLHVMHTGASSVRSMTYGPIFE